MVSNKKYVFNVIPVQKKNTYETPKYKNLSAPKKINTPVKKVQNGEKKKSGCVTIIGFIPFLIAIIGLIGNIAGDVFSEFTSSTPEPDYSYTEEYDPYEWVIDEIDRVTLEKIHGLYFENQD